MAEPYRLEFARSARKALDSLDPPTARRILKKLEWLAQIAGQYPHHALAGQWSGAYRLRVGDYRIIYTLDHGALVVLVIKIGHRRELYDE